MKIYCLGAAHLDVKAFPLVEPTQGESIPVTTLTCFGGVIRNIAENLSNLGAFPFLLSIIGDDVEGKGLLADLSKKGINTRDVLISSQLPTAKYYALLDQEGELFVATADMSIYDELTPDLALPKISQRQDILDWIVDANLPEETIAIIAKTAPSQGRLWGVGVSAAKAPRFKKGLPYFHGLFLNLSELRTLTDQSDLYDGIRLLLRRGVKQVFITAGSQAIYYSEGSLIHERPCPKADVLEVTGAGDAFSAAVIYSLAQGDDLKGGIEHGFLAAKRTLSSTNSTFVEAIS